MEALCAYVQCKSFRPILHVSNCFSEHLIKKHLKILKFEFQKITLFSENYKGSAFNKKFVKHAFKLKNCFVF